MRKIDTIIIHCAATYPKMDIGAEEIREWHTRDNGWSDIGYHFVIRRDGTVEAGRPVEQPGAHCKNHNARSIGVCLVGGLCGGKVCEHEMVTFASGQRGKPEANYTETQYAALKLLLARLTGEYATATVHGHQDFANKACPCFDVAAWWEEIRHA